MSFIRTMPKWARNLIFDFFTTAIPALLALSVVGDPEVVVKSVALALGAALVAAVTRAVPAFSAWLAGELNVQE